MIYITDSVQEDTPEYAVFGKDTYGIVDDSQGGVVAYVHKDNAQQFRDAWDMYNRK